MTTINEIGNMLDILEANYGQKFYDGVDKDNVIKLWSVNFQDDDPKIMMQAVQNCINTMSYKPTIADIRQRMVQVQVMTEMEVFQAIKDAVHASGSEESAYQAFNALPGMCRKIVRQPSQLRDWYFISADTFETVVASMISRSYRVYADREAEYYTLPAQIQQTEAWRIAAPDMAVLPEPKRQKTFEEMERDRELAEIEYRKRFGIEVTPEMVERNQKKVNAFMQPMTDEELKRIAEKEEQEFERKKREWLKEEK
ncbi:MAG: hypothetical protein IJI57_04960 [Flexilinea sp.]|nr:hypothetical protein [Flexilinea sp.]